jgi:hypothetical protein
LICEVAGKLFDSWAIRRVILVQSLDDVPSFSDEQKLYLSQIIRPSLPGLALDYFETDAIEMTIAGRQQYWLSEAIARISAQVGPCLSVCSQAIDSKDQVVHGSAIPQPEPTAGEVDRRAGIDAFISRVNQIGSKSTRKDIWTVAGYTDATEFERFQRHDPRATPSAADNFNGVLKMKPDEFIRRRDRFREKKRVLS